MVLRLHKMTFSIFVSSVIFPTLQWLRRVVSGLTIASPHRFARQKKNEGTFLRSFHYIFSSSWVVVRGVGHMEHAPLHGQNTTTHLIPIFIHHRWQRHRRRLWAWGQGRGRQRWFYVYSLTRIYWVQYHYHSLSLSSIYLRPPQSHLLSPPFILFIFPCSCIEQL